jgi:uncharacterized membrane protein
MEDEAERITRNWDELLQELRVTQTGVQILTGFLLTVPFSQRFASLDDLQRRTYLIVLAGSVLTTGLVVAPAAFHRVLFRQHERRWLVEAANRCARASLATMALTISGVLFLAFDIVAGDAAGWIAIAVALVFFASLWWVTPKLLGRHE